MAAFEVSKGRALGALVLLALALCARSADVMDELAVMETSRTSGIMDDVKEWCRNTRDNIVEARDNLKNGFSDFKKQASDIVQKASGLGDTVNKVLTTMEEMFNAVKDGVVCVAKNSATFLQKFRTYDYDKPCGTDGLLGKIIKILQLKGWDTKWVTRLCNLYEAVKEIFVNCTPFKEIGQVLDFVLSFTPVSMVAQKINQGLDKVIEHLQNPPSFLEVSADTCLDKKSFTDDEYSYYNTNSKGIYLAKFFMQEIEIILEAYAAYLDLAMNDQALGKLMKEEVTMIPTSVTVKGKTVTWFKTPVKKSGLLHFVLFVIKSINLSLDIAASYNDVCRERASYYKVQDTKWKVYGPTIAASLTTIGASQTQTQTACSACASCKSLDTAATLALANKIYDKVK